MALRRGSLDIVNEFSGFEYTLINFANMCAVDPDTNVKLDAIPFEERIQWSLENVKDFRRLKSLAEETYCFARVCYELENMEKYYRTNGSFKGYKSGFMVGFDATNSVLQLMGTASACPLTCKFTNLVDPNVRYDFYTLAWEYFKKIAPPQLVTSLGTIGRKAIKDMVMHYAYGGIATICKTFAGPYLKAGLKAFETMMWNLCPGAMRLRKLLLSAINIDKLYYDWTSIDGFAIHTKMTTLEKFKVTLQQVRNAAGNEATFTHAKEMVGPDAYYCATGANGIHSIDSYAAREMHRRMNFNPEALYSAYQMIQTVKSREITSVKQAMSIREAMKIAEGGVSTLKNYTENQLGILEVLIADVLQFDPAPLITVHDEFKTYPAHMGQARYHYRNILAEIADSDYVNQMLRELHRDPTVTLQKGNENVGDMIRQSRYAIC